MVAVNLKSWDIVQARHVDTWSCINRFYVIVWPIIDYNNSLWSLFSSENYYSCITMTYKVIIHFICQQRITSSVPQSGSCCYAEMIEFFFREGRVVIHRCLSSSSSFTILHPEGSTLATEERWFFKGILSFFTLSFSFLFHFSHWFILFFHYSSPFFCYFI